MTISSSSSSSKQEPIVGGAAPAREPAGRVLFVDDDAAMRGIAERALGQARFEVRTFSSATDALEALEKSGGAIDVLFTDLYMPEMSGLELASRMRASWPETVVVLVTGQADMESAIGALRLGVYDYVIKGGDTGTALVPIARRALEYRRLIDRNRYLERQLEVSARFDSMVGTSAAIREIQALVASVAPTSATVLILGESGTGKELVARAIHKQSPRSAKPFVDVNCAALTETLLESELFGHERGAFTGAHAAHRGLFEEASGGTLFLDEIGDIGPALQVRLLRALQEGTVRPVGGNDSRAVDVRVIAATNRDLERAVQAGRFRQDLYYRLNVVGIDVPPLRDRVEDIAALAYHFLEKRGTKLGKTVRQIDADALRLFTEYSWPGNVRELQNAIERGIVLCRSDTITADLLPPTIQNAEPVERSILNAPVLAPFADARAKFERDYVERAVALAGGSLTGAARLADIDRANFRRMVKRLRGEDA